ncbi:MAG: T9SS type A sorting domain-containing protein [Chlorobi bacterium]|nr:T9SS type A sorting domain-containing protein [Chlorobiota bacterium]
MKTTFAFFLSLFSLFIFGQNTYQIADTTKTWNTVSYGFLSFNVAQCSGTKSHILSGETNIGNITYFNVFESTDSLQTDWGQIGFLREDTINHQVYYRGNADDGLLYDFNIEIGDSIYIDNYYYDFTDALLICDSIDYVNINGEQKQRFYFYSDFSKSIYSEIWIEDIGSMYGLLASGYGGVGFGGGAPKLLCCSKNDDIIYMDTVFNTCYIDEFFPKITSAYYDTAYLNTAYEFQLQLSDTSDIGSISWWGEYIPDGFSFDASTGIISGIPDSPGSFPCGITITNNDIGLITDMLESEIVVLLPEGISMVDKNISLEVFPNPSSNLVNIKSDIQINSIKIYNYAGQLIWDKKTDAGFYEINTSQFEAGIYFFRIEIGKGVVSKRIVVQ